MSYLTYIIPDFFHRDLLSIASDVLSIISFVLTIFVLYDTRKIRAVYKFKGRGPALIKDLSKQASNLSDYLNEFENFIPQIAVEMGRSQAKLKSLEKKLGGPLKVSVKRLIAAIEEVNGENEQEVRRVHIEMIKVIEEVKEHRKDLEWET